MYVLITNSGADGGARAPPDSNHVTPVTMERFAFSPFGEDFPAPRRLAARPGRRRLPPSEPAAAAAAAGGAARLTVDEGVVVSRMAQEGLQAALEQDRRTPVLVAHLTVTVTEIIYRARNFGGFPCGVRTPPSASSREKKGTERASAPAQLQHK